TKGKIRKADGLRIVYFDQNRQLDPEVTLRRALAPDSDAVIYQERVIHVASWAERFLFASEQLNQWVGRLSGGERARVLIAQLMLSYQESRELAGIEGRITVAEQELQIRHKALEDPEVMGDHVRLQNVLAEMAKAQKIVDALYARWAELEQEQG